MPKSEKPTWFKVRQALGLGENNLPELPPTQRKLVSKIIRDLDLGQTDSLITYLKSGYEGLPSIIRLRLVKMLEGESETILTIRPGHNIPRLASSKARKQLLKSANYHLGLEVKKAGGLKDSQFEAAIQTVMDKTGYKKRKVKLAWQVYLDAKVANFSTEELEIDGGRRAVAQRLEEEAIIKRGGLNERQYRRLLKSLIAEGPCCNHTLRQQQKLPHYALDEFGFQTFIFED